MTVVGEAVRSRASSPFGAEIALDLSSLGRVNIDNRRFDALRDLDERSRQSLRSAAGGLDAILGHRGTAGENRADADAGQHGDRGERRNPEAQLAQQNFFGISGLF